MSVESAKEFYKRLKEDEEFAKKINDTQDNEERVKLVKDEGYDFTLEELNGVIHEETGKKLSDEELENIAGGIVGTATVIGAAVTGVVAAAGGTVGTAVSSAVTNKTK